MRTSTGSMSVMKMIGKSGIVRKRSFRPSQQKIMEEVCAVPVVQSLQLWAWNEKLDLGVEVNGSLNLSPPVTEIATFRE